jgi:hypothetical protein
MTCIHGQSAWQASRARQSPSYQQLLVTCWDCCQPPMHQAELSCLCFGRILYRQCWCYAHVYSMLSCGLAGKVDCNICICSQCCDIMQPRNSLATHQKGFQPLPNPRRLRVGAPGSSTSVTPAVLRRVPKAVHWGLYVAAWHSS